MARRNGTPAVPVESFLADMFEDWSNDRLAEFVFDTRSYALDRRLSVTLSDAADIAGRLAENELETREALQRRIVAELYPAPAVAMEGATK